jgi:dTMP kinase
VDFAAVKRGVFIAIEGLDGAGTTTQCQRVAAALKAQSLKVTVTAEPTSGPIGALIRQALNARVTLPDGRGPLSDETLALLFAADRVDHGEAILEPALSSGAVVLSDRSLLSSLAYQGARVGMPWVNELNSRAIVPDLTVFISIDVATAEARRAARGLRADLFENRATQLSTKKQYAKAIALRRSKKDPIVEVDGTLAVDEVTRSILDVVMPKVLPAPRRKR